MKKTLSALSITLVFACIAGCKKNSSGGPKETVLSQAFTNDKISMAFEYNDKKQLSKITEYDLSTGKPSYAQAFTYDSKGRLDAIFDYNGSGKLTGKEQYYKDLAGQFTKVDYLAVSGTDSGKVQTRIVYTYNKSGFIIKEAWVDLLSGKEQVYRKYTWYDNGNMKTSEYYGKLNPETLFWESDYSPAGNPLPETIASHSGYPINYWNFYFVAEEIHSFSTAAAGSIQEKKELMSKRKYDNEGLLIEQTITENYINPVSLPKISVIKYVYKQL